MRETRNGFQLVILLYSVHDIRSRFTLPPTYFLLLDREPPEQEESCAAPQKSPQSEKASLPHWSESVMEWPHLCHIRVIWHVLQKRVRICLWKPGIPKKPFSSETGIAFLPEHFFSAAFCLLKADVWQLTAC